MAEVGRSGRQKPQPGAVQGRLGPQAGIPTGVWGGPSREPEGGCQPPLSGQAVGLAHQQAMCQTESGSGNKNKKPPLSMEPFEGATAALDSPYLAPIISNACHLNKYVQGIQGSWRSTTFDP
jgi:hypothetical protein